VVAKGQVTRMQAAYASERDVRDLVGKLRSGSRPLLLDATGTDDSSRLAGLAGHLRERIQRIK
jgi:hypothetical protein